MVTFCFFRRRSLSCMCVYVTCNDCPRTILLLLLTVAAGGVWVIEQPSSSLMKRHLRFRWYIQRLRAHWLLYSSCVSATFAVGVGVAFLDVYVHLFGIFCLCRCNRETMRGPTQHTVQFAITCQSEVILVSSVQCVELGRSTEWFVCTILGVILETI
jgi:hypothetical protein